MTKSGSIESPTPSGLRQVKIQSRQQNSPLWLPIRLLWQLGVNPFKRLGWRNQALLAGVVLTLFLLKPPIIPNWFEPIPNQTVPNPPLAMSGGDPYLRALMRTISVSESNQAQPYQLLYGGTYFEGWERHPDRCLPIVAGPNVGQCTTAAGRYQFITTTWQEKAHLYHPDPRGWMFWQSYPFDPVSQDRVVYNWLADAGAWGTDLSELLRADQLDEVLYRLSGTWTSLGYGIEDNAMTPYLQSRYDQFLQEELARVDPS